MSDQVIIETIQRRQIEHTHRLIAEWRDGGLSLQRYSEMRRLARRYRIVL